MTTPRATYRLQFRDDFGFAAAADIADYLARLGISHVYASPVFAARSGSSHGYDVTDFNAFDASLGGRAGFDRMVETFRAHDLGLILDFVPNHMAASIENAWWRDALQHGRRSAHAETFDIDWDRFGGRVLLPVLADPYGAVLERGEITVVSENEGDWVAYFDHRFPVSPESKAMLAEAGDGSGLHDFLEAQHYRLCHWRLAPDAINYRRFFDINELAVIRVDRPEVYERVHKLVFDLIGDGSIDGLRLDHIDGLKDPTAYLKRLQADAAAARGAEPFYLLVEKILGPGETLRGDWPVAGTTGYEFANLVTGLQVEARGADVLRDRYQAFSGDRQSFSEVAEAAKRYVLALSFSGELRALTELAHRRAQEHLTTRDIGAEALRRAIVEVLVALPVYRTYVTSEGAHDDDVARIDAVCATAAAVLGQEGADALAFLRRLMKAEDGDAGFAMRLQQLSGPLMAKSIEDTAFYRFVPLLALNEVGGHPGGKLTSIDTFHAANRRRREHWPDSLLTTSTHDTKRGEDARARLAGLSYVPEWFADAVERWWALQQPLRRPLAGGDAPHPKDAWLFYQALAGAWPPTLSAENGPGLAKLRQRLLQYLEKALREAKERTRWTDVDKEYEAAMGDFVAAALDPLQSGEFISEVRSLVDLTSAATAANALAQLLFTLTAPGVPDIYQGTEWWDFSLVDPDNRRTVDYEWRAEALEGADGALDLGQGSAKQQVIQKVLTLRRNDPELFARGDYRALEIRGPAGDAVVAYARILEQRTLIVCALRHGSVASETLHGSEVVLGEPLARVEWKDMFGGRRLTPQPAHPLPTVFGSLPIALLHGRAQGS